MQVPRRSLGALAQRYAGVFLILSAACSIIEDSDLQSPSDFDKLQLESIRIVQVVNDRAKVSTNNFNDIRVTRQAPATILADTALEGVEGLSRVVWYSLSSLGDNKLKFRSGTTGSVKIYVYYTDTGEPYTLGVVNAADEVVELYRFRYYTSGKLARISTFVVQAPDTLFIRDSLFYSPSGRIEEIRRNHSVVGPVTATMEYLSDALGLINKVDYSNGQTVRWQGSGGCPDSQLEEIDCGDFEQTFNGGGQSPTANISMLTNFSRVQVLRLRDPRNGDSGCQNCNRELDTYYFHPTMFLANELQRGFDLLEYYMVDWWVLGAQISGTVGQVNDETVTFEFVYAAALP